MSPDPRGANSVPVTLTVNGKRHVLALDLLSTLLDVLREDLVLSGT